MHTTHSKYHVELFPCNLGNELSPWNTNDDTERPSVPIQVKGDGSSVWKQKFFFFFLIYELQYSIGQGDNINTDKYQGFPPNDLYLKMSPSA